jgi:hypothetical protein
VLDDLAACCCVRYRDSLLNQLQMWAMLVLDTKCFLALIEFSLCGRIVFIFLVLFIYFYTSYVLGLRPFVLSNEIELLIKKSIGVTSSILGLLTM